jgi:hypothetical protein
MIDDRNPHVDPTVCVNAAKDGPERIPWIGPAKIFLWIITTAAVVFFVFAVQRSAILFPFWDHCEFISYFSKIHDHTLRISELWAPHNHSRPLMLRIIILLNGVLTNWDIRSEYVYLIGFLICAFLAQAWALYRICGSNSLRYAALICLLAIFSFSPASHNDHWWSFMIQLDLTHLLVILAFLAITLRPNRWSNNLLAAGACWLATYTIINGLVTFVVAALIVQAISEKPLRVNRFTVFWCLNLVMALALYLPHLAESPNEIHLWSIVAFSLAYLGSPIGALINFPFRDMFDVPAMSFFNGVLGAIILFAAIWMCVALRRQIQRGEFATLLFLACSCFAVGSALLTALGRAEFGTLGIGNANASRYTLFGTYLGYALIYAGAAEWKSGFPARIQGRLRTKRGVTLSTLALFVFVICACRSYFRSVKIYAEAHAYNQHLAAAFLENSASDQKFVYPDTDLLRGMELELRRLKIGPYTYATAISAPEANSSNGIDELAANKLADEFGIDGVRTLPSVGRVLFANPRSRFELPTARGTRSVHFEFGIYDTALATKPPTQGVVFRLLLKRASGGDSVLWSQALNPVSRPEDRGVHESTVPVDAREPDQLIFETLPIHNAENAWAYWRHVIRGN